VGAVLAAVHHAEIIAHRVGEPFGSLVLAMAVTVIEVALILTLLAAGGPGSHSLARDTVFAAVMITANGIVGIALLVGAMRHGITRFNSEGIGAALAVVATLATVTLASPTFTSFRPGPEFSPQQLGFAAIASLTLYALFVLTQTVRHRDFFLPSPKAKQQKTRTHLRPQCGRLWSALACSALRGADSGHRAGKNSVTNYRGKGNPGRHPRIFRRGRHSAARTVA
jgi:Ca2+:H+ antiporter